MVPDVDMNDEAPTLNDDGIDPAARAAGHQPALTGCPWHDVNEMLQAAGLRPTRQRMALGWLLFGKGARHLTAEMLYEEATLAKVPVSLATVYNTLNQLTDAGPAAPGFRRWHQDLFRHQRHGAPPLLSREQPRAGRYPRSASGAVADAGSAGGLRDRPRRHGRAAAQEALRFLRLSSPRTRGPITTADHCSKKASTRAPRPPGRGVWVPAFAGTTQALCSERKPQSTFSSA